MYSQILNELFGFCCYHQIINENKGIEFRKLFFDITQNSYENKLSEYVKDFNNKQHQFYIDNYFSKIDENIYFNELIDSTVDTSNIGITEK
jgi:carbamoylphosphate synthase small subunit